MNDDYYAYDRPLPRDAVYYGILRKSGRYPWGSGADEYARSQQFYQVTNQMKDQGLSETEIAKGVGLSVADLRAARTIAKEEIVLEQTRRAVTLSDKGVSIQKISDELGIPKPTVRLRIANSEKEKKTALRSTAEVIRSAVDKHEIVDVGKGVSYSLGIKGTRLKAALAVLRDEGYETHSVKVKNVGTNNFTNTLVMVKEGVGFSGANRMKDRIHTMGEHSEDDGKTFFGIHPPLSISSKRLAIKYAEDGGTDEDGVVYVRPGVKDLDMGKNSYAQVRIMIDGTHFIKGMAVKKEGLPDGVDLLFNTNKSKSVGKLGALKPIKDDPDNPFGSMIKRQITEIDPKTGKERASSGLNIVNESGDWDTWRKSVPSQVLAKQPQPLIKSQLKETRDQVKARIDEINRITNPVVRRKKMEDLAEQIDADAVDLRAAAMPRQKTQVILPMPKMNKEEIYAPNFETGERVVLIRFPHGGRFEIPEVTVNNNNRTAKKILGNAKDAIGIHPSVAEKLSGADFDGDTVLVIPNPAGRIKGSKSMGRDARVFDDGLKNFDPKRKYGGFVETGKDKDGKPVGNFKLMRNTGLEMGQITNLITDMSIQGAKADHVLRAVKHSMVVIDAEKHKLDYKQSEIDNGIRQLKELYQGSSKAGASTLLSRATAPIKEPIPERKLRSAKNGGPIDRKTGEKVYEPTGNMRSKYDPKTKTYLDEKVLVTERPKRLEVAKDAFSLVRDKNDPVERLYAEHANDMKALANQARLEASRIPNPKINTRAKEVYRAELDTLVRDLDNALRQAPLSRKADVLAGITVKAKMKEDPTLREDRDRKKKVERQAKEAARARLGLEKPVINITDRQWDAIQAGAVSANRLSEILRFADPKRIEQLSLPKPNTVVTGALASRAAAMLKAGATNADVARNLGISPSTLREAIARGDL